MAVQWDPAYPPGRKPTAEGAVERINAMLLKAYISVKAVTRDTDAQDRYTTHFIDQTQLAQATNIIKLMHDRMTTPGQVVVMHNVLNDAAFIALGVGSLPAGISMQNVEAFVIQRGIIPATPLHIYIGPAFYTDDVFVPTLDQRSGTGTILHELSHGVGNTHDHAYTWDVTYAALTAAQRADNADTYRAYCQSFDTK